MEGTPANQNYNYALLSSTIVLLLLCTTAFAATSLNLTPANGSAISGTVNVSCTYNSPPGGAWVNIGVDGNQVYSSNGPSGSYSWDTNGLSGGHTVQCIAYHWDDNIGGVQDGSTSNDVTLGSGPGPTPAPIPGTKPATTPASGRVKGTYYVDPSGSDSNSGTSPSSPWKTLSKVMSIQSSLRAGQSVLLKGGGVWNEQFDVNAAGSPGNPIVFGTYGSGRATIDGQGRRYCVDAVGSTARYLTFDNWECRHATEQGVTFQTSGGGMPGITVQNFWIHDTGPGCSSSDGPCVGYDDQNYANQLDFEDFGQGADGVRFLNNTVQWCGGHNCLEVHFDTGAVQVNGNKVGPGCVHGCLDVKGIGNSSNHGVISGNSSGCGLSQNLCGEAGQSAAYYTENPYNTQGQYTDYSNDQAQDSPVGFQACAGACASGSNCPMHLSYTSDSYSGNSIALYLDNGGCGGGSNSTATAVQSGDSWGGGSVSMQGFN